MRVPRSKDIFNVCQHKSENPTKRSKESSKKPIENLTRIQKRDAYIVCSKGHKEEDYDYVKGKSKTKAIMSKLEILMKQLDQSSCCTTDRDDLKLTMQKTTMNQLG